MSGSLVVHEVEALVDRVGAAEVPVLVDALLGRHGRDVVAEQRRHAPRLRHVRVEAVRLVLRQHDDLEVAGVDDVGQREVDEPVDAGERHGGFGPVGGERHQPLALPAGEHDGEDFRTSSWASSGHERHPRAAVRPLTGSARKIGRAFRFAGSTAALGSERARRHPQQGVPAGHLRRRGGSRGRARPGAARAAATSTCRCAASAPRATRPARRRTPTCRSSPAATPRCRPSASTSAWPATASGADLVHSHTWYANLAGHLASLLGGMPHVVTAHSLEPMRPWKAEQLGGGYRVSSWAERTAYEAAAAVIAVSAGMRDDILKSYPSLDPARVHVVHNGIDSQLWRPTLDRGHRDRPPARRRPRQAARSSSSAGSPARRACRYLLRACRAAAARRPARALRRRPRHPGDPGRGRGAHERAAGPARGRRLDPRHAAARTRSSRC